jgi:hypothetical protein
MFEQQGVWANCEEASFFSGDLQQDSTFETTETSTKFAPQKCFSILKENEAVTTATAMTVDIIFVNAECFML